MENFKVIGHEWETIYNEDILSMEIKLNKKYYEPLKQAYEQKQILLNLNPNISGYDSHVEIEVLTLEILKPIMEELKNAYINYNINVIKNNEETLNKYVLNNNGECLIGYHEDGNNDFNEIRNMFFETGLLNKKLELLLKDNDLKDYIDGTWECNMDLDYTDCPGIRFENFDFTTFWSLIYISGII